ncbi:MAG: hypothetical protein AB7T59_14360 [Hyphomonadaceae bacterium]
MPDATERGGDLPPAPARSATAIVIENLLKRRRWSVKDLADRTGASETSIRKWRCNGNMTSASRRCVAESLGFESWGQLASFVVPAGEAFALKHYAPDLECIWAHYIEEEASPIFETKIALSLGFGFPAAVNVKLRHALGKGDITLHRVEQPRAPNRLAELAANALYFNDTPHYVLRIVPPLKESLLVTYPNFIRFGKKALVIGRTHKIGAPGANDPVVLMIGEAAEVLGDHLESAIWNDANAMPFSTLDESHRLATCKAWARAIAGQGGVEQFERCYRDLTASTKAMEAIRV